MPTIKTVEALSEETLVILLPEEQKVDKSKGDGKKKSSKDIIKYYTSQFLYKDPVDNEDYGFYLRYPLCMCQGGVLVKENEDGSSNYSIKLSFMPLGEKNEDARLKFIDSMDLLYNKMTEHVYKNRSKLKIDASYTPEMIKPLVKAPLYHKLGPDGTRVAGTSPSQYVKLMKFDNGQTPFFDLKDQVVPWDKLVDVQFLCIPTVRYRHLYTGAKSSAQIQVKQVQIMGKIEPIKEFNMNADLTARIRKEDDSKVREQQDSIREMDVNSFYRKKAEDTAATSDDDDIMQ